MRRIRNLSLFAIVLLLLIFFTGGTYLSYLHAVTLADPVRTTVPPPPESLSGLRDVVISTDDGLKLNGWYVPPPESSGPAVLYVHGIGGNRGQLVDVAAFLLGEGYGALLFDLRNSGDSEGERTTMGLEEVRDVQAAFDFLVAQPEVDASRIVVYGHSMGGSTAILAMPLLPDAQALIIETAYTSLYDVVSDGVRTISGLPPFPWAQITMGLANSIAATDMYDARPIDGVDDIAPRPILFLHGSADFTIPVAHSQALYEAAGEPRQIVIVEGAGHDNIYETAPDVFEAALRDFLADL